MQLTLLSNTVFADGAPQGRIMLIGEAPARTRPPGLPSSARRQALIACSQPSRSIAPRFTSPMCSIRARRRTATSPEKPRPAFLLHRHIELVEPQILILLGAVSARHVDQPKAPRLRGRWNVYQSAGLGRAIPVMRPCIRPICCASPRPSALPGDLCLVAGKFEELGLPESRHSHQALRQDATDG